MKLVIDSREILPLEFPKVEGVDVSVEGLPFGDYSARHPIEPNSLHHTQDPVVIERKAIGDLFTSFTGQSYEREKAKWQRAQAAGFSYVLAIEAPFSDVLKGHAYRSDGTWKESRKSGLGMVRQLCSVERRYNVHVRYFTSRKEMALWIIEFYLSFERMPKGESA